MAKSGTKAYKIYATAAGAASAFILIAQDGIITGVSWALTIFSGAVVNTGELAEITLNSSSSNLTTNDTPGTVIDNCSVSTAVASSSGSANKITVGLAIPVKAGDRIYLNNTNLPAACAAASSRAFEVTVYVQ